jgi:hypothetical protein
MHSSGSVAERIAALANTSRSLQRRTKLPGDLLENAVVALPTVVSPADGSVSAADLAGSASPTCASSSGGRSARR